MNDAQIADIYRAVFEGSPGCARSAPRELPVLIYTFARALLVPIYNTTGNLAGHPRTRALYREVRLPHIGETATAHGVRAAAAFMKLCEELESELAKASS